jgi:PilZ domain
MHEREVKKNLRAAASEAGTVAADRRNADRHTFTASAEVVELGSGARFSARTTDLGPGGCFVDTILPFPVGSEVRVTVGKGQTHFETNGLVVYSQTGLGMGIAFDTLERYQREALDDWLVELTGSKQSIARNARAGQDSATAKRPETSAAVVRFVRLMISKGIITEAEGASVLHDPVL